MAQQYVQTGKILDILLSPKDSHKVSLKSLIYSEENNFTNIPALQVLVTEILKCLFPSILLLLILRQTCTGACSCLESSPDGQEDTVGPRSAPRRACHAVRLAHWAAQAHSGIREVRFICVHANWETEEGGLGPPECHAHVSGAPAREGRGAGRPRTAAAASQRATRCAIADVWSLLIPL